MISLGSNSMTGPGLQNPWSCRFSHLIWTCERVERDTRLTESFFKRKWAATNWTYAILIYSASKVWSGRLTCDYEGRPIRLRRWWWRRRRRWRRRRQWCWWSTKSTKFFAGWRCPCGAGHPLPLRTIGAIKTPFTGGGRPSTGNSDKLLIWLQSRVLPLLYQLEHLFFYWDLYRKEKKRCKKRKGGWLVGVGNSHSVQPVFSQINPTL